MVRAFSWVSLVALAGFHPGVLGWSLVFNGFCKLMMSPALANIDRQRLSFCPLDNECTGKAELSLCDPQCGASVVVPCLACLRTLRPRTAFDWKQCLELLVPSLSNDSFAAKASEDGYAVKWLCRTFLVSPPLCKSACGPREHNVSVLAVSLNGLVGIVSIHMIVRSEMRAAGISGLELTIVITKTMKVFSGLGGLSSPFSEAETIHGFAALFPDQSNWLAEFGQLFDAEYVAQLLEHLQFDQPAELLTMYLCIFLAPSQLNVMHECLCCVCKVCCNQAYVFMCQCSCVCVWSAVCLCLFMLVSGKAHVVVVPLFQ